MGLFSYLSYLRIAAFVSRVTLYKRSLENLLKKDLETTTAIIELENLNVYSC